MSSSRTKRKAGGTGLGRKAAGRDPLPGLLDKIANRTARVGVVGLGYVGLPLLVEFAKAGFVCTGIDLDVRRVKALNRGQSFIEDVDSAELQRLRSAGKLSATATYQGAGDLDLIVICVPTPMTRNLVPDLTCVTACARSLAAHLRRGQFISLESTTYPGTTDELLRSILEAGGLRAERDFFLAFSPERVDPGNPKFKTGNINKVIGGVGPRSLEVGLAFYRAAIPSMLAVSSARAAEMVKLYEGIFRAVNIGLVNEYCQLCDRMGLNVWEVLDAAFTKPFGIMPFYPGPGVGGHCIPIDPHYLEWKAKEFDFTTRFIAVAGETNRSMPAFVAHKAARLLNARKIAAAGARILLLGVAYKANLGDYRESPALFLLEQLRLLGATVRYHDPHVPAIDHDGWALRSVPLTAGELRKADLVIIATAHKQFDYPWVLRHARQVLDTRNATKAVTEQRRKIELL